MPVLRFRVERLYELLNMEPRMLSELLFRLKCESEEREGYLEVEVNADRPDMFIGEGLARAVKGLLGVNSGWAKPRVVDSGFKLLVEDVPTRPYIVAAVVYNVNIDSEYYLEELIQFQEKLHEGLGRRRRKAAIGLHDADKIPGRMLRYAMAPLDVVFKPLGYTKPVTARELLESDAKGLEYGWISRLGDRHPFIFSDNEIITMPPVINSDITRLEVGTRNIFVDVTSTDLQVAEAILNIIVSNLAERPGAYVGLVEVKAPWGGFYPRLQPRVIRVKPSDINGVLGSKLTVSDIKSLLERMRYNVNVDNDVIEVEIPPYRVDVTSVVDLAEDVAIAVGYEELNPTLWQPRTRGEYHGLTRLSRSVRMILVGLGFTEVMKLSLTSPQLLEALGLRGEAVEVLNPVQLEYSVLRPSIVVTLLDLLTGNKHSPKPIKVFEIGPVVARVEGGIVEDERVGLAVMDDEVSYEDIQAPVYYMLRVLGVNFTARPARTPYTMEGRTAELVAGGVRLGVLGEIKPEVLEKLELEYPVAVAEISLGRLLEALKEY
jgi:phenylalanyl-tRNA synthetase beta chain